MSLSKKCSKNYNPQKLENRYQKMTHRTKFNNNNMKLKALQYAQKMIIVIAVSRL